MLDLFFWFFAIIGIGAYSAVGIPIGLSLAFATRLESLPFVVGLLLAAVLAAGWPAVILFLLVFSKK